MERTGVDKDNDKLYYMKKIKHKQNKLWQNTSSNISDFFKSFFDLLKGLDFNNNVSNYM